MLMADVLEQVWIPDSASQNADPVRLVLKIRIRGATRG